MLRSQMKVMENWNIFDIRLLLDDLSCKKFVELEMEKWGFEYVEDRDIIVLIDQATLEFNFIWFLSSISLLSSSFIFLIILAPTSLGIIMADLRLLLLTPSFYLSRSLSNKEN